MSKILRTILVIFIMATPCFAQLDTVWTITIGDSLSEGARSICPTSDGGAVLAGYTFSEGNGSSDILLVKIDAFGNELNSYTYGGALRDYANRVRQTGDGGYVIVGYTSSFGTGGKDVYLLKINSSGIQEWQATYGTAVEEIGQDVIQTSDGGYIISGWAESDELGEHDTYIIKVDSNGNEEWSDIYDGLGSTSGDAIFQLGGNYVFGGTKTSPGGTDNRDSYLTWIDSDGDIYDMGTYGSDLNLNHDWCHSIIRTDDGGYLLVGHASRHNREIYDFNAIKVESDGSFRWQQLLGVSTFYDFGRDAVQTSDGGYILCGVTKSTINGNNVHLIKIDSTGNELWSTTIDTPGSSWADDICEISNGYLVAGQTNARGNGAFDIFVMMLSNLESSFAVDTPSGHAPHEVNFTDQSLGNASSWEWDFDNDGVTDSYDQNPAHEYTSPGNYSVRLKISDGIHSTETTYEDYVRVFDGQSALEFDGEVSYVSSPASESMNLIGPFTIEAWIHPYGWGENISMGMGSILDKNYIELSLYDHGGLNSHSLVFYFRDSGGAGGFINTPENSITLDQWQHIAVSYDAINEVNIYINGVSQELTSTTAIDGPIQDNSDIDLIVGNSIEGSHTFDGVIDELRIWDTVRSGHLINVCMNNYVDGGSDNLILNWRMDEGGDEFAWDNSYYLNSGMLIDVRWAAGKQLEPTDIESESNFLPEKSGLSQAYPNPFNNSAIICYRLDRPDMIKLEIFDILGRKIETIAEGRMPSGEHKVTWNAKGMPSGIYFYKLSSGKNTEVRKMMLLK